MAVCFSVKLRKENCSGISSQEEKCDVVENSAYGVTVQGSAGDRLEPDYNMENNPLYETRSLSND